MSPGISLVCLMLYQEVLALLLAILQMLSEMAFEASNVHAAANVERAVTSSLELTSIVKVYGGLPISSGESRL